jgi:glycosyltransferase involved in cell wall biosynthesis
MQEHLKKSTFSIELIIAAYNNVTATKCVLDSLLNQTDQDFMVAIADDGSGPEIANLANEYRKKGLNIRHVYQEDKGFRRARILNKAVKSSTADYLIFLDNDVVVERNFISDHRYVAKPGYFISGRRVTLGPEVTQKYFNLHKDNSWLENRWRLIWWGITKKLTGGEYAFRLPWKLAILWSKRPLALLGSNFGVWREDFIRINGYDNEFNEYGCADVDVEWRLLASGIKSQALRGRGCGFHLYHKQKPSSKSNRNYMEENRKNNQYIAKNGINSLN